MTRAKTMLRAGAIAVLLLAAGRAQGATWVVDAANGPGTDFTDLQAALASPQVADGDQLRVRAGSYGPCATSKGVTILGEPGARITTTTAPSALSVTGLAAGRTFVLHRFTIDHGWAAEGISLQNDQGRVHLSEVTFTSFVIQKHALKVSACSLVTVHRCSATGLSSGFHSANSGLVVTESAVVGQFQTTETTRTNTAGLTIDGGSAWLAQLTATGGVGIVSGRAMREPAPGISATDANVVLAGDGLVSAGQTGATTSTASAIHLFRSTLTLAPTVRLAPFAAWPPIHAVTSTVVTTPLPYLTATSAPPAGTLALALTSAPGDAVFLGLALPGPQLALPFGTTWLDLGTLVTLAFTTQGPSGQLGLQLPVPNQPELRGLLLVVQAANSAALSGALTLTNPAFVVLH